MGSAFHQLCPRYSGTLTPTAPTAIRLWETFTFYPDANSIDPVQTPQYAVSDLGQHCLPKGISMQNTVKVNAFTRSPINYKWTHPHDKDGQVHWSEKG